MTVLIDCDTCRARGPGCADCVISVLLDEAPQVDLDDSEGRAMGALAAGGMVPPLRLVWPGPLPRRGWPNSGRQ